MVKWTDVRPGSSVEELNEYDIRIQRGSLQWKGCANRLMSPASNTSISYQGQSLPSIEGKCPDVSSLVARSILNRYANAYLKTMAKGYFFLPCSPRTLHYLSPVWALLPYRRLEQLCSLPRFERTFLPSLRHSYQWYGCSGKVTYVLTQDPQQMPLATRSQSGICAQGSERRLWKPHRRPLAEAYSPSHLCFPASSPAERTSVLMIFGAAAARLGRGEAVQ